MYSYGPPHMAGQKQDDQHKHTFSSYVRIRDVALMTSLRRWTIGKSGERGSGISMLVAPHDDDDDIYIRFIYIMPSNLVCDPWVSWSFYKITIICQLTKWNLPDNCCFVKAPWNPGVVYLITWHQIYKSNIYLFIIIMQ